MVMVTIELPDSIRVPLSDTGLYTEVPIKRIVENPNGNGPKQVRFAALAGWEGALNNISRGKDENGKPNSDSVFAATRDKRMKPWIEGQESFGNTERGESQYTAMRDEWISDYMLRAKVTKGQAEAFIKAKVAERLGKDTKATFGAFLDATALDIVDAKQAKDTDEARKLLEDSLRAKIAERAANAEKLDVPAFDLTAFKKAK